MTKRTFLQTCALALAAAVAAGCSADGPSRDAATSRQPTNAARQGAAQPQPNSPAPPRAQTAHGPQAAGGGHGAHDGHNHEDPGDRVPAFETSPASLKKLPPTLSPALFTGRQKLAYQAVKEIPQTIAQLPCYCYCDKGFGHKSLHSCFVDDHAAHCAVCVDEALLALQMQTQEKLTPQQIRERIVARYGGGQ